MSSDFTRFTDSDIASSIVKDIQEAKTNPISDLDKPFGLVDWLINTSENFGKPDEYIAAHVRYIKSWYKSKNSIKAVDDVAIVGVYGQFLREVLLVYSSQEESRYLRNLNWQSVYDLDIVVPFYAKRLRDIILYVVDQRDKIKLQKVRNSFRGSVDGLKRFVYDEIIELLKSERYYLQYSNKLPTISQVVYDLNITVEETYDTHAGYNNNPGGSDTAVDRYRQTDIDPAALFDLDTAILNVLSAYPMSLSATSVGVLVNEASLQIIPTSEVDVDDLSRLSDDYFINYTNSTETLNINTHVEWYKSYIGTTTHYISSVDGSSYVTGVAVEPYKALHNHLNVTHPQVSHIPMDELSTTREIGGYFQSTGITHCISIGHTYTIDQTKLSPGYYQVFPDPTVYSIPNSPVKHVEDYKWIKADKANDRLHGDIIDAETRQKFYSYQSADETNKYPKVGISRSSDNFDFWMGDRSDVWANSDVYEVLLTYDYGPVKDERIEDLLLGNRRVTRWKSDVFGNEYVMLKDIDRLKVPQIEPPPSTNPCRVLDGQVYWDDVTYELPEFDAHVDGSQALSGYPLSGATDYAYGGFFSPYECDGYVCYCPCEESIL